jgi:small subunit ribosomal protein S20
MENRARRTTLRGKLRKCSDSLLHGTVEQVGQAVETAVKVLDREANRKTLHRNAAARRKSRLARKLNALRAKSAG